MEKIIEESKQGESLILENKPENTKKTIYRKLWLCDEFFGQQIVASILSANGYNTNPRRSRFGFGKHLLHSLKQNKQCKTFRKIQCCEAY
jgi:hypothetical protein